MKLGNIAKLSLIQGKFILFKVKSALFMFVLIVILALLFILSWKNRERPKVIICNEENSILAQLAFNSVLSDKAVEIADFERADYKTGKKLVDTGKVTLLIHIKKGIINTLYQGKKATIDIYAKNKDSDFTKTVASYIKGFVDIINVSQNAGVAYMNVLYYKGVPEKKRNREFFNMQKDYVGLTLARTGIFDGTDRVGGFTRKNLKIAYFAIAALFFMFISVEMIVNNEIFYKPVRERLKLSGISNFEIYFTLFAWQLLIDVVLSAFFIIFWRIIGIGD